MDIAAMSRPPEADIPLTASRGRLESSPRRRAMALLVAVGIEILLLLAFLNLDFVGDRKPEFKGGTLTTFDVSGDKPTARPAKVKQVTAAAAKRPAPPRPRIVLPPRPLDLLVVSKEVYAASDIAKLGHPSPAPGAAATGELAQGSAPGDSARVGTGPNGEPLYAAEWYREPTHQELSTYLPERMPDGGGWGLVACRTVANYHVDDCVELGNGPLGSHLARSVRQAAWQFLVRPPRVGGRPQVGEWVRIRIDYSVK